MVKQNKNIIKEKINKFKMISQEEGLMAAVVHSMNFLIAKTGWFNNHWWIGKLVELFGNKVYIDGCQFSLDTPLIPTALKSRFVIGKYEKSERRAIRSFLNPSLPVIEFGASIGVVSCITNKKLKNSKDHVVVEANPELIPLLITNRNLNNCSFTIINKALGYDSKEVTFYMHRIFSSGGTERVTDKPISVQTVTLSNIFAEYQFRYSNLICDIEGGEVGLVINELELLSEKVFQLIIEVHPSIIGEETVHLMREKLKSAGFRKIRTGVYGNVLVFENSNLKTHILQVA